MTGEFDHLQQRVTREQRLGLIIDGYEADGPDSSVPGAARPTGSSHPRYVVVTESTRGHGYFVNLAADQAGIEQVAAANVDEGWMPVCYFDLDELAGDEPHIYQDDVVSYQAEDVAYNYRVDHVDEELIEGEVGRYLCLVEVGRESESWDDYDHRVHEDDVEIVERGEPDERMPVRYGVAGIRTVVAFNTIPSP